MAARSSRRLRVDPGDLVGGVSAAFVLIPQALAYATLAGMPVERGLFVAALAPIAAAFFASSPYLGTGPTAITSLLTFGALSALAMPASSYYVALAALLALLVGVIRVALGLARAGFIAYLMSQPLITGFTTGAAVVIVASQVPTVLDVATDEANPFVAAYEALRHPEAWRPESFGIAVVVAILIIGGRKVHRLFPGVLVAVVLAIAYSEFASYDGAVVGDISGRLPPISLDLPWSSVAHLIAPALVIAVVGFSEPAAIARHYATLERKGWDANRELISQGAASLAAGLGGGFPAGGSFSRSALVRDAGARTRLAGGITGLVVLAILPFMSLLSALPSAVLGASIIVAVRELITIRSFVEYRRYARLQFAVAVATFLLTIAFAPHIERAVIIGVVLAIGAHLWRELRLSIPAWISDGTLHLAPKGVLYFASAPGLEDAFSRLLDEHQDAHRLVVHLDGLGRIDLTGALVLRNLLQDAKHAGLEVELADAPPPAQKIIARVIEGQD
ncbi:MAG: STAS domain-containing protein [Chloroflexi bacterium]|nr:STAS domain-containing protein [Chloroflexota bacterium]